MKTLVVVQYWEQQGNKLLILPDKYPKYQLDTKLLPVQAWELSHSRFRISRLMAYAAYHLRDRQMAEEAWTDLFTRLEHTPAPPFHITTILPPEVPAPLDECTSISTNDAALWSLDAIYMQEVIPRDE